MFNVSHEQFAKLFGRGGRMEGGKISKITPLSRRISQAGGRSVVNDRSQQQRLRMCYHSAVETRHFNWRSLL